MMNPEQKVSASECLFQSLGDLFTQGDLNFLDGNISQMQYMSGEVILKQGTWVSQVVFIQSGIAKIVLEGKNDKNTILKIAEGPDFIALPVLGDPGMYPYSVIALSDVNVCFIRKEAMQKIMDENIKVNHFLLKWYSADYMFLYKKITTISQRNNHGKLATVLLYLTNGKFKSDVLNMLSRKELAELASVSVESVNKIIMELKNDMIISIINKSISIEKRELIEKLSTVG